ncbi:hypothetical protein FWK35_00003500, partial [Aphis craccivora]
LVSFLSPVLDLVATVFLAAAFLAAGADFGASAAFFLVASFLAFSGSFFDLLSVALLAVDFLFRLISFLGRFSLSFRIIFLLICGFFFSSGWCRFLVSGFLFSWSFFFWGSFLFRCWFLFRGRFLFGSWFFISCRFFVCRFLFSGLFGIK